MTEKKYVLPVPEAIEFLETSLRELEERACYRFRDIEKRLADLESDECSRCGLVIKKEDYIASRENSMTCHLPTTKVVGLPLRKKSRGVWQGDSSP